MADPGTFDKEELATLKAALGPLRKADKTYDIDEVVDFTDAIAKTGDRHWHSLRVSLYGYIYPRVDPKEVQGPWPFPDEEEPEFITYGSRDGVVKVSTTPAVAGDPPEVLPWQPVLPSMPLGRTVLTHNTLSHGRHAVAVGSAAFDTASSLYKQIAKSLGQDLATVGVQYPLPVPAGQATFNSLVNWVTTLVGGLVSDDVVGGDQPIADSGRVEWLCGDRLEWSAWKWARFARPNQTPSYLTLWRLELTTEDVEFEYALGSAPTTDLAALKAQVADRPEYAAALRRLQGADLATVAAAYGVGEQTVDQQTAALLGATGADFDSLLRRGILAELAHLRDEVDALRPAAIPAPREGNGGQRRRGPALQRLDQRLAATARGRVRGAT